MGLYVGLMTGTSLDGIDAALVEIEEANTGPNVTMLDFVTLPFSEEERETIMKASSVDTSDVQLICSLNFHLGEKLAEAVEIICKKNGIPAEKLTAIGSHGQTIYHQPQPTGNYRASTLQIGEPAVIAYRSNATVVANFRVMDMAAGGQGAPLVPYTEWKLFRDQHKNRLLQNIGGIANVTVLPARANLHEILAFDTGPGNMIIDELCKRFFCLPFDGGGELAAQGKVDEGVLDYCLQDSYFKQKPPKSTGRELFGTSYVNQLVATFTDLSAYDWLATMTKFTAITIADSYKRFIFPNWHVDEIIIGGGGSYNLTLLRMLAEELKGSCQIRTQEELGYSSEAKEAVAFALLAHETLQGRASNIPSATGAKECVILGTITYPPRMN
ncbi:anhydro-N-acetylmuramic acid kinase AnmK [Brevibacillus daliensis]|uniref:anhydro-N-acetylmuramic acid kinase AnmK n=1 Tax=Brevibacillus daliensis TaxID=2892995 RepID=UPI001E5FAF77|nr:anhydro-N-acetylmuramic acid kinase AnmK [Brevibacillus daliensis]